jgi:hypothetical protein
VRSTTGAAFLDGGEQRLGSAHVDEGVRRQSGEGGVQVDVALLVLRDEGDLAAGERGQFAAEGHGGAAAAAVHQAEGDAVAVGPAGHGEDRGDADAAGDEDVRRGRLQDEVVAGAGDAHPLAGAQPGVDVA